MSRKGAIYRLSIAGLLLVVISDNPIEAIIGIGLIVASVLLAIIHPPNTTDPTDKHPEHTMD